MGKPLPLVALAVLLAALALRELLAPLPTVQRSAPPSSPQPSGASGANTGDDDGDDGDDDGDDGDDDPFADLGPDVSMPLLDWLEGALGADDADAFGFSLGEEGFSTLGDLLEADMTDEDLKDLEMPPVTRRKLLRKLQEARTDGGGSARHSSAKASDFDFDETRSSTPKAAPVPPIKAALGTFLRYSFYVGKFGIGISRSFVVEMCITPGRAQGWHCSGLGRSFSRRPVCRSPHGIHKWWRIRRKS